MRVYIKIFLKFQIDFKGQIPKGPKIFAINHPTTLDPFIIYCLFPNSKVLIYNEVFKIWILGWILKKLGHIPVDAENKESAYITAKETLLRGDDIIIFPEGKISTNICTLDRIKTGITRLAVETHATIIPIGVNVKEEGIRKYKLKNRKGVTLTSSWYMFNKYVVNIGRSMSIKGDINNRDFVKKKSIYIQEEIQKLCRKYFYNLNEQ